MAARLAIISILLSMFGTLGCRSMNRPQLRNPGPTQVQQYNAILHDPYADRDAGPEFAGSRPRNFSKPLAEPVRTRWLRDSFWSGQ